MKVFQTIGVIVTLLAAMGALGIGHFRLHYGQKVICTPAQEAPTHD